MILIGAGFALLILNLILLLYRYGYALYNVQEIIFSNNILYIFLASLLPFIWWVYSTKLDFWHFYNRKKKTLAMCILNASLCVIQTLWTLTFDLVVVPICRIPTGRNLDAQMLFILCRITLGAVTIILLYAVYALMRRLYENDEIRENIETVRWQHLVDTRKNKKTAYDLDILKKMEDGKKMLIYDVDRFVHMFILGASGTGKTSSTLTPAIICDFDKKIENREKRLPLIMKFLKEGKGVAYEKPGKELDEYDIVANSTENKEELEKIRDEFPDCGTTVMAPDNSLNVDVIKLAEARKISVNVIDPSFRYKNKNVKMKGLNPFYVRLGLDPEERVIEIVNKAQNFKDVLLAVSEIHGVGDQYFRDINASVTTNISIMCMLHANLQGRQTNITEIQSCIADFGKLASKVEEIQEALRIKVIVHPPASSKNNNMRQDAKKSDKELIPDADIDEVGSDDIIFNEVVSEDEIPLEYRQKGITVEQYNKQLREEGESYAEPIHFVLQELLGTGAEKMFDQARGLRNILQNMLMEPRIRKILSAPDDAIIDFDKALANGEVTVINTGIELGPTSSTALGLFIMLSLKMAVLRRPVANRTNHFIYIDEASQYMHPMYEDMFALFRKYKTGVVLAIQSLSQMDKTDTTRYLKGVIMGAGIHIVFGRTDPDTMKYYEEIAGITHKETIQTQTSSNSELDENYNISSGRRKTVEEKQAVEGHEIRIRDFQEVTVFMVKQGQVLKGIHAKTAFPKKSDYAEKRVTKFDFSKYSEEDPQARYLRERSEGNKEAAKNLDENYRTNQRVINLRDEDDMVGTLPSFQGIDTKQLSGSSEVIKQRAGNINMLIDSINTSSYTAVSDDESRYHEQEPFTPLNASLLGPNRKNKVVDLEKKKVERAEAVKQKESRRQKENAAKAAMQNEDMDLDELLADNPFNDDDSQSVVETEEELDEMAVLQAELEKLNGEKRG